MPLFAAAAIVGLVHAVASLYWAVGGDLLLETVGQFAVDTRRSGDPAVTLMLWVIGLLKVAGALVPWLDHRHPPAHRWVRVVSWLGVAVMMLWGGAGTVGAWIALAGRTASTANPAVLGHAFLWDPLFVAWALLLAGGLIVSRQAWRRRDSTPEAGVTPRPVARRKKR